MWIIPTTQSNLESCHRQRIMSGKVWHQQVQVWVGFEFGFGLRFRFGFGFRFDLSTMTLISWFWPQNRPDQTPGPIPMPIPMPMPMPTPTPRPIPMLTPTSTPTLTPPRILTRKSVTQVWVESPLASLGKEKKCPQSFPLEKFA